MSKNLTVNSKKLSMRSAFTLVELLVVISIIALLLAILMPALQGARRQAQGVVCGSNCHQIGILLGMYLQDNKGRFPYSTAAAANNSTAGMTYEQYYNAVTWWRFLGSYINNKACNKCPGNPANPIVRQFNSTQSVEVNPKAFGYAFNVEFGYLEPDPNLQKNPATAISPSPDNTPFYFPIRDGDVRSPGNKIIATESAVVYISTKYMYAGGYSDLGCLEYSYRIYPGGTDDLMWKNYGFKAGAIHGGAVNNIFADGSSRKLTRKEYTIAALWWPVPSRISSNTNPWGIKTRRPSGAPKD